MGLYRGLPIASRASVIHVDLAPTRDYIILITGRVYAAIVHTCDTKRHTNRLSAVFQTNGKCCRPRSDGLAWQGTEFAYDRGVAVASKPLAFHRIY